MFNLFFFFQAEDGIRDRSPSRGLGDVYKRQGVMVTASHNPARDNGYKVYLGDGCQIVPPWDVEIAAHIAQVGLVADVPRSGSGWTTMDDDVLEAYLNAASAVVAPGSPRELC